MNAYGSATRRSDAKCAQIHGILVYIRVCARLDTLREESIENIHARGTKCRVFGPGEKPPGIRMNSAARGWNRKKTGEDELWKNAAKNVPFSICSRVFPRLYHRTANFPSSRSITIGMQFKKKKTKEKK